jgi:succinoglycan biosynthesis protein ExoM
MNVAGTSHGVWGMDGGWPRHPVPSTFCAEATMDKVAICVCTFRRPVMLRACLNSLARQQVGPDLIVSIVVVDNEPEPNNCARVGGFAEDCPFPVHYTHEPRRGIAAARNAALD